MWRTHIWTTQNLQGLKLCLIPWSRSKGWLQFRDEKTRPCDRKKITAIAHFRENVSNRPSELTYINCRNMNSIDVEWSIMQSRTIAHTTRKPSKRNYCRLFWYLTDFLSLPLPRVTWKKKKQVPRDQTVHREDLLPVTSRQQKLTNHLPWRMRQFLGVVRFINWVSERNIYVWAEAWGKWNIKFDERNERCRYTERTGVRGGNILLLSLYLRTGDTFQ
jgi:hypothetical protein